MGFLKIAIFSFIAVFLVYSLTRNFFSYREKAQFYSSLKSEYNKEEDRNKKLKSDIKRSSDYYYVERKIREKLNLLQPDETAVIIPPISPSPTPTPVVVKKPYELWLELLCRGCKVRHAL